MENNYLQEDKQTINKIKRILFENVTLTGIYFLIFRLMKGRFGGEQKFFMHLTEDQNFISKLLFTFSLTTFSAISLSIIIYLAKRFFLTRYRHIRSNLFFLNNRWIVTLNCLLKTCGYIMLIMSFMSLQRLLLTVAFISVFSLLEERRGSEYQLSPGFFSWKDRRLCRLFSYSLILAISFPLYDAISATQFIQKLKNNISSWALKVKEELPEGANKIINDTFASVPFGSLLLSGQKILGEILNSKEAKGGFFAVVLLNFVKNGVGQDISSFRNFWKEITATTRRVEWFKLFANFQLAARNKKTKSFVQGINGFPILCYESFILSPNFIRQAYTENVDSFDRSFVKEIESINELVRLVNNQVSDEKEKSFIFYWLFNHVKSFQDFSLYSESINQLNNIYSKHTST